MFYRTIIAVLLMASICLAQPHRLQSDLERAQMSATGKAFYVPSAGGFMFAWGAGAPGVGAGYAPGCLYIDTSAGTAYRNAGTATVASFTDAMAASGTGDWVVASGDTLTVESGGNIVVESGGALALESGAASDHESGATLGIAGVTVAASAAEIDAMTTQVTVYNDLGVTIPKGTLLRVNGWNSSENAASIEYADALGRIYLADLVAVEDILNGATGVADGQAIVTGIDTSGAAGTGSLAYLDTSNGLFTWTTPSAAHWMEIQIVGYCITKDAVTGSMFFIPQWQRSYGFGSSSYRSGSVISDRIAINADMNWPDDIELNFGDASGGDLRMEWTSATDIFSILPGTDDTGAVNFGNGTADVDVKIFLGTTGEYAQFDVGDSAVKLVGVPLTVTGATTVGQDAAGHNVIFYGDTSGKKWWWDQANDKVELDGWMDIDGYADVDANDATNYGHNVYNAGNGGGLFVNSAGTGNVFDFQDGGVSVLTYPDGGPLALAASLFLADDNDITFGNVAATPDIYLGWDTTATDMLILRSQADDTVFQIGNGTTTSMDILWHAGAAADSIEFDASDKEITVDGVDIIMNDDDKIYLGDAKEFTIEYDEDGTDDLRFTAAADLTLGYYFTAGTGLAGATNAGGIFDVTTGVGGAGAGGGTAGAGGALNLATAAGGTETTGDGGAGGAVGVTLGNGGATSGAAGDGGDGGTFTLTTGDGGADGEGGTGTGGDAGDIVLKLGNVGAGSVAGTAGLIQFLPTTTDSGAVNIGNGTLDMDLKIFMDSTAAFVNFDQNAQEVIVEGTKFNFMDNDSIEFGDSADMIVDFDSGTNVLMAVGTALAGTGFDFDGGTGHNVTGATDATIHGGAVAVATGAGGTAETGNAGNAGDMALAGAAGGDTTGIAGDAGNGGSIAITSGGGGDDTETSAGTGGDAGSIVMTLGAYGTGNANGAAGLVQFLPATTDIGAVNIGDGTTDMDFKVFMDSTAAFVNFDQSGQTVVYEGTTINLMDNDALLLGDSSDVSIDYDSASGDLHVIGLVDTGVGAKIAASAGADGATNDGGAIDLDTGEGGNGAGAGTAGAGGATTLNTGAGGTETTGDGGAGGALTVVLGNGGATSGAAGDGGDGGAISWTSGTGGADSDGGSGTGGDAGDITITLGGIGAGATPGTAGLISFLPTTTDVGAVNIGNGTLDMDLKVFMDSAAAYVNFDQSTQLVTFEGTDVILMDDDKLILGDSSDAQVEWNQTYLELGPAAGLWANAPFPGQPSLKSSTGLPNFEFFDDFVKPPTVSATPDAGNTWLLTLVDGGVDAGETWNLADDSPGGVWAIVTNDADNDSNSLQVNGESFKPAAGKHIWFECRFKINDAGLGEYFIGLAEAVAGENITAPDDCIGFLNQDGTADETIKFVGDKATAEDLNDSSVALLDNTWTTVGFFVNGVTDVTAYIDGTEVGALALATTNITVEAVSPLISVRNASAAVSTLSVDYVKVVQLR